MTNDIQALGSNQALSSLEKVTALLVPVEHSASNAGLPVVGRPRLMQHFDRGQGLPLTLVIGPAGFGKTTVMRQWADLLERPPVWIQANERIGDAKAFAKQLVSMIQTHLGGQGFSGAQTHVALTSGDIHPRLIGRALAEDIVTIQTPVTVVVDDFHVVSHSDVPLFVTGLLDVAPVNLRLVVASRWDPRLSLVRMRQEGRILDIRAAELQFSPLETEELLVQMLGQIPATRTVPSILEFTGGWIAAVRLAALSMSQSGEPSRLTDQIAIMSERNMLDYLMDEVLDRKPERWRQLVIRSSAFGRMCGSLAESVLDLPPGPDSTESMLDHLALVGLVVPQREGDEFWYTPHPLFRTLLHRRLALELPETEIAALHLRASRWFEGSEMITPAIEQCLEAGAIGEAVALVKRWRLRFFMLERWQEVESWLDLLPTEIVEDHLTLRLTRMRTNVMRGLEAPTWPAIEDARRLLESVDAPNRDQTWIHLMSELDMVAVHSNALREDTDDPVAVADRALAALSPEDSTGRGVAYAQWAEGMQARGDADAALDRLQHALNSEPDRSGALHGRILIAEATVFLRRGDLRRARDMFLRVLHIADVHAIRTMAGWARLGLGMLAYERNELGEAEDNFSEILDEPADVHFSAIREAMVGLVLVAHVKGDHARVETLLDNLRDWSMDRGLMNALVLVDSLRARLCLLDGDRRQARQWSPITAQQTRDYLLFIEIPMLTNAKVALSSSTPESLTSALFQILDIERWASNTHNYRRLVEIKALRAHGLHKLGDTQAAVNLMREVLELVGHEPYARTFLDLGFDLEPIFREMATSGARPSNMDRVLSIVRLARVAGHKDFEPNQPGFEYSSPPVRVYEVFTEREVDVLLAISQHLSNKEIAEKLFVSPLTVKRHATNIYRKLGVNSRRQALIKATELGYLV